MLICELNDAHDILSRPRENDALRTRYFHRAIIFVEEQVFPFAEDGVSAQEFGEVAYEMRIREILR